MACVVRAATRRQVRLGRPVDEQLPPPSAIEPSAIEAARARIAGTILRTPLVKLQSSNDPEIYLKLENLQQINSFKLRGAANAVATLSPERRARGVWTISAGNAGQGVAYAARQVRRTCTVVTIETAPETKVARMRHSARNSLRPRSTRAGKRWSDGVFPASRHLRASVRR